MKNSFQIRALVGTCAALIIFLMKISLNPFQIRALVGTTQGKKYFIFQIVKMAFPNF